MTVAAILERNNRFLMVEELAAGQRVFNQPAGHLEHDESLPEAAVRETLEETAWHISIQHLVGIYLWQNPTGRQTFLRVTFAGTCRTHDPGRRLDQGILRAVWLTRSEIGSLGSRLRSPLVLRCLDDYLAGARYPLDVLSRLDEVTESLGLDASA